MDGAKKQGTRTKSSNREKQRRREENKGLLSKGKMIKY